MNMSVFRRAPVLEEFARLLYCREAAEEVDGNASEKARVVDLAGRTQVHEAQVFVNQSVHFGGTRRLFERVPLARLRHGDLMDGDPPLEASHDRGLPALVVAIPPKYPDAPATASVAGGGIELTGDEGAVPSVPHEAAVTRLHGASIASPQPTSITALCWAWRHAGTRRLRCTGT